MTWTGPAHQSRSRPHSTVHMGGPYAAGSSELLRTTAADLRRTGRTSLPAIGASSASSHRHGEAGLFERPSPLQVTQQGPMTHHAGTALAHRESKGARDTGDASGDSGAANRPLAPAPWPQSLGLQTCKPHETVILTPPRGQVPDLVNRRCAPVPTRPAGTPPHPSAPGTQRCAGEPRTPWSAVLTNTSTPTAQEIAP